MRNIVFMLLVLSVLSAPTLADSACLDNSTSLFNTTISVSGSSIPIFYNTTCPFLCDNKTGFCVDSDIGLGSIGIVIVVSILALIFIFAAGREELSFTFKLHSFNFDPIKLLFLGLAFFMILTDFGLIMNFAKVTGQSGAYSILSGGYLGITTGFLIIASILLIVFLYAVVKEMISFNKRHSG